MCDKKSANIYLFFIFFRTRYLIKVLKYFIVGIQLQNLLNFDLKYEHIYFSVSDEQKAVKIILHSWANFPLLTVFLLIFICNFNGGAWN